ncbi:MAG: aminotransferase class I/II-fold pyridoxal phosphate-dependent enzyme [Acidobacteria bacterium]|nr:aminotransferase class I/II-fold pyridoxal phosphate-dependent enzyme [Acidobacteriota bacterium]
MRMPLHGGQLRALAERFGVAEDSLLDFSANINPDGPPVGVRLALREAVEADSTLTLYPDLEERALRQAIARHLGIQVEAVIVGNGFVPLLSAVLAALGVRRCLLAVPCFNEYRRTLEQVGVGVVPFALQVAEGFAYDLDAMLAAAVGGGCDAVLLANPQNPSGVMAKRAAVLRLVERAAGLGVRVLVDEAFVDYAPEESVVFEGVASAASAENLVVFRSVTKFFALAGLRVAYGVASAAVAGRVRERIAPWSITTLASIGVMAALSDAVYAAEARRRNLARQEALASALASLGVRVFAGRANFLLFQAASDAGLWERMIVRGVVLRYCGEYEGLEAGFYRVAVRDEGENERLVEALRLELGG